MSIEKVKSLFAEYAAARIYNRALSADEIALLANEFTPAE